jgi:hypothetical protein
VSIERIVGSGVETRFLSPPFRKEDRLSALRVMTRLSALFLVGGLIAGTQIAGAGAAPSRSSVVRYGASHQVVRTVRAAHRISALPRATALKRGKRGIDALRSLQGVVNRSYSVRPKVSRPSTANTLGVPAVPPTKVSTTSGATVSFRGLNDYEQRYVASAGNQFTITPPDQGLCVGNGFVMETVNDVIRVFDTTGAPLTNPIGMNAFYGYPPEINRTTGEYGPEPTDPSCYYDPQYRRWFHVALTLETDPATGDLTLDNHLDIAVSATSSPLDGWTFYRMPVQDDGTQGTPHHTDCPCVGDYPHIGADENGFFITTNEYPWGSGPGLFGNNYNGAQVYAMSKFWLAQASPTLGVVQMSGLSLPGDIPSFTMWPNEVPGTSYDTAHNGTEWFMQSQATAETLNGTGMADTIGVWRITNTASLDTGPALSLEGETLGSQIYGVPPLSAQKAGPVPLRDCLLIECLSGVGPSPGEVESPLDSNDSRMQQTWLADGMLYGAIDTIMTVDGNIQAGVAYFVLQTSSTFGSVSVASQGYVGVKGNNITYPAIATLDDGTGAMAMTLVGPKYYPSAAYMDVGTAGPGGPVVMAKRGKGPDDEFCGYLFFNCGGTASAPAIRPRWGDYGAAAVAGSSIWIASEYIAQKCSLPTFEVNPTCGNKRAAFGNWATRISQVVPD